MIGEVTATRNTGNTLTLVIAESAIVLQLVIRWVVTTIILIPVQELEEIGGWVLFRGGCLILDKL